MTTVAEGPGATIVSATAPARQSAPEPAAVRPHRTRADAVRNRERIVAAARDVFVEYGTEGPLDEIARRAGIGNATLYRHFPDRRALAHAVLLTVVTRTADHAVAEAAGVAAGGDPCAALRRFAHTAVDEKIGALCGLLVNGDTASTVAAAKAAGSADGAGSADRAATSDSAPTTHTVGAATDAADLAAQTARLKGALDALMAAGRDRGRLRADVTRDDMMVAISRLTRPLPGLDCPGDDVHRHLQLFLDGLKAPAADSAPDTVPDPDPAPVH